MAVRRGRAPNKPLSVVKKKAPPKLSARQAGWTRVFAQFRERSPDEFDKLVEYVYEEMIDLKKRDVGRPKRIDERILTLTWVAVEFERLENGTNISRSCKTVADEGGLFLMSMTIGCGRVESELQEWVDPGRVRAFFYQAKRRQSSDELFRSVCTKFLAFKLLKARGLRVPSRLPSLDEVKSQLYGHI